ncbi:MAG: GatB/YqeY domain-containing protein [Clostridium sp.]|nr:GatB/YqeY domain-containing protein [Clostridium sp.]
MYDSIKSEIVKAMKEHNKERLNVLRMVKAAVDLEHIDKKVEINDELVLSVVLKQVKMREDSIEQYSKTSRSDLVEKETMELNILKEFLPKPLTDSEVDELISEAIDEIKPEGMKDMGKVMGYLSPKVKGRTDQKALSMKIKERLQ